MVKNSPAEVGDVGSIPESERSHEEGNDNPLQRSYLGNLMDGGAWGHEESGTTEHLHKCSFQFSSVQFNHSVVSDSLRPHELQHARPPCPSPTP